MHDHFVPLFFTLSGREKTVNKSKKIVHVHSLDKSMNSGRVVVFCSASCSFRVHRRVKRGPFTNSASHEWRSLTPHHVTVCRVVHRNF